MYEIGDELGRGAVASVRVVSDANGARFAGKFLHASRDGDDAAARRFEQEAGLLAGIEHPHIVTVYGMARGRDAQGETREFVRMELVEGEGLDIFLAKRGPITERVAAEFGRQLAAGLACAHGRGIVHRDLKPANVLVRDPQGLPQLKIADFGMARASSLSGVDPSALTVLGTPDYMAPESLNPLAVDARTDLYALGCMLFEMLSGRVPFAGATPFGILQRHRDDPVPTLDDAISPEMRGLVQSLLAKSAADRPPSAAAVVERLEALSAEGGGALVPLGSIGSSCAGCGQQLVEELAVCLNCGLPCVTLEAGSFSLIIHGPGEVGDKIDANLRELLVDWMDKSPHLGLSGRKSIRKNIPRLPVVFAVKLSERSARAMAASLGALGMECDVHEGRLLRHTGLRSKAKKLSGRAFLIVGASMLYMGQHGAAILAGLGLGAIGAMTATTIGSLRAVTEQSGAGRKSLSGPLREALDVVEEAVPALEEARHRHGLRAVVRDALAMREHLGDDASSDAELAAALRGAATTSVALARLDRKLEQLDLHRAGDDTRDLLHQRDLWAGRMLELAGTLDSLRLRLGRSKSKAIGPEALKDLRLQIEALEEVQSL